RAGVRKVGFKGNFYFRAFVALLPVGFAAFAPLHFGAAGFAFGVSRHDVAVGVLEIFVQRADRRIGVELVVLALDGNHQIVAVGFVIIVVRLKRFHQFAKTLVQTALRARRQRNLRENRRLVGGRFHLFALQKLRKPRIALL